MTLPYAAAAAKEAEVGPESEAGRTSMNRPFHWPLAALAVGAFGIGTTEFAPIGLLPVIADGLGVSISKAGLLVSGYALGVLLGAPLLTLPTSRLNRKTLLIAMMALFTVGNLLAAGATSFGSLLFARIITSLCHASLFGVGSVVAARLAPPGRQSAAVSAMFSGLTIANIGGVPMAAWIGQHIGWRTAFVGIGLLGVAALSSLALAMPSLPPDANVDVRRELAELRKGSVLLALATTALGSSAMFTVFTYIAPILRNVTHVSNNAVNLALVVFGVGLIVGNWLGGRFADNSLRRALMAVFLSLSALLLIFALTMHWPAPAILTIFAWGVATFALVPPLQARVMNVASDAPNLASAINIGAFNLGNAVGAVLGGGVIAIGLPYSWIPVAGAFAAVGGLLLVGISPRST